MASFRIISAVFNQSALNPLDLKSCPVDELSEAPIKVAEDRVVPLCNTLLRRERMLDL
jgi:hypothetical protein